MNCEYLSPSTIFAARLIRTISARAAPQGEPILDVHSLLLPYSIRHSLLRLLWSTRSPTIFGADYLVEHVMGWLCVVLLELNITSLHQRNMMFCMEWYLSPDFSNLGFTYENSCGVPVSSNKTSAQCKQCNSKVQLRPNPRIVSVHDPVNCPFFWAIELRA